MSLRASVMEHPLVYRLWQAPFAEKKLAPFFSHNDVPSIRRVLDVGCGPGTNAAHFSQTEYVGVDINPDYIADARRRHPGARFVVADVTTAPELGNGGRFDCVLVNSFLHHVNDADAGNILDHLAPLVSFEGYVHLLELVLPARRSPARLLAHLDRGRYARPLDAWSALFTSRYEPAVFEAYALGAMGVTLWDMVYFKGRPRSR